MKELAQSSRRGACGRWPQRSLALCEGGACAKHCLPQKQTSKTASVLTNSFQMSPIS